MPETKGQGVSISFRSTTINIHLTDRLQEKKDQSAPPPQPKEAHEHEEVCFIYYPQVFT